MEIGNYIRILREQRGLSREIMAEHLGMGINTYAKIETGRRSLKLRELQILAEVFETDFRDFAGKPENYLLRVREHSTHFDPFEHVLIRKEVLEDLMEKLREISALLHSRNEENK